MRVQIIGLRDEEMSARDGCVLLKNNVVIGNRRLSLNEAGNLYNLVKLGRTVNVDVPFPSMLLRDFQLSKQSMAAVYRRLKDQYQNATVVNHG